MKVLHGTWIPQAARDFVREGGFSLWLETDEAGTRRRKGPAPGLHPRQLTAPALQPTIEEALALAPPDRRGTHLKPLQRCFVLPTAAGEPLPSPEMARYLGSGAPEAFELRPWLVQCYPVALSTLPVALKQAHLLAQREDPDLAIGTDLLFWYQYFLAFKAHLTRDSYIPALVAREQQVAGPVRAGAAPFYELHPSWEIVSAAYEDDVAAFAAAMPPVCTAGHEEAPAEAVLFEPVALLRHFSEVFLHHVVVSTPLSARLESQVAGTFIAGCVKPWAYRQATHAVAAGAPLDEYRAWRVWRDALIRGPVAARFTLCFQLLEAPSGQDDAWSIRFLVASRRDPSLKLPLEDYWPLTGRARAAALREYGESFERDLLLALGHAARIYPRVWDGLDTDRPAGFHLSLDESFAFLRDAAWILQDAGYTVIVPAWWTPQGRRRLRVRLHTTPTGGPAATPSGYFNLDSLVSYRYELSLDGQPLSPAEWAALVAAKTPLVHVRGQWMELDRAAMEQMLAFWRSQAGTGEAQMTVADLLRLDAERADDIEWDHDEALAAMLSRLHDTSRLQPVDDPPGLRGSLRPYQKRGLAWLRYLEGLGLNPCLADDMGLGKCLAKDTVLHLRGKLQTVEAVWNSYAGETTFDGEGEGEGEWAVPTTPLMVTSLDQATGRLVAAPVRRLYRQYVAERLRRVTLDDGSSITITRRHRLLTPGGWTTALHAGALVCVAAGTTGAEPRSAPHTGSRHAVAGGVAVAPHGAPAGSRPAGRLAPPERPAESLAFSPIARIEWVDYRDWVYDLEVDGHHNFVANTILCHNTIQVIARLVDERDASGEIAPTLLIAPTSVLGNWGRELARFAPGLRAMIHHGAARIKDAASFHAASTAHDVVITSFSLARMDETLLRGVAWHRVVVDEAQNIKNPRAAQTRSILRLRAAHRLALTGTPVENRLMDLWSIFNFLSPGYLGKEGQFRASFELPIGRESDAAAASTLRRLVEPFILRRVKSDREIIADLPDKVEQKVYCTLSREQASLYEAVVKEAGEGLESLEGMGRRGLILATLTRLKQICNHPAQYLGDGSAFSPDRSPKLERLLEMAEEVLESGDSMLVFTQYAEVGTALERVLREARRYATYYLHGGVDRGRRERMVAEFQDPATGPAIFILSLRAGGTGLTLTKANHVFHFDRWWNPAVEDQATDRAFRIGQRKNVLVHKFVALGTLEERIDAMLEDKKRLVSLVVGADESWLTELDNEAFKELISLSRGAMLE